MNLMLNLLMVVGLFFSSYPAATTSASTEGTTWLTKADTLDHMASYCTYLAQQLDAQVEKPHPKYRGSFHKSLSLPPVTYNYDCKIMDFLSTRAMTSFGIHSWSIMAIEDGSPSAVSKGIRLFYADSNCRSLTCFYRVVKKIIAEIKTGWIETKCREKSDTHVLFDKSLFSHNEKQIIDLLLLRFKLRDHADCFYDWHPLLEEDSLYLRIRKVHLQEFQRIFNFDLKMRKHQASAHTGGGGAGCAVVES